MTVTPAEADAIQDLATWSATTDTALDWASLQAELPRVAALTQQQRCELVLRVASGDALTPTEWLNLVGAGIAGPIRIIEGSGSQLPARAPSAARAAFRKVLDAIIKAPEKAIESASVGQNVAKILNSNVIVCPEMTMVGRRWIVRERVIARSPAEAVVYGLRLLLDPKLEIGRTLRKCQLPQCGRFELVKPRKTRGRPPHHYCCETHENDHKAALNSTKVAKWRKHQRAAGSIDQ